MSAQNISSKVPKYGPAVPPVGVLWSALRATGEKIDLPFLTGISGAAFRTCCDDEASDDVLWLEGNKAAESALPLLGYELHFIAHGFPHAGKATPADREKLFVELQAMLDGGTPAILTGSFGWALVLGYDKGQGQYWIRQVSPWNAVRDMSHCPPWEAGIEQEERWETEETIAAGWNGGVNLAVLRKRGRPLPKKGLAINALRHATVHSREKNRGSKHFGLKALEFLSNRLIREADELKWDLQIYGSALPMQVIFYALNRAGAVAFLKDAAVEFEGKKQSLLEECASIYQQSAHEWLLLQSSLPNPQAYYESKDTVKKDPEALRHMAESLKKILEIERRAIMEIESIV